MIVHDGHLGRPISGPSENDAPLVIDPNGVKARQIAPERFRTVAGRNGKVAEDASLIHLDRLSQRDPGHGREAAAASVAEQRRLPAILKVSLPLFRVPPDAVGPPPREA